MIKRIDHIGIAVRNLEESLAFYCGVLGFRQDGEISSAASDPDELNAMGVTAGNAYRCVVLKTPQDGVLEMFDFQTNSICAAQLPRPPNIHQDLFSRRSS